MQDMNVREVAKALGKSERTIRKYVAEDKIPYYKSGPLEYHLRFKREDIVEWLQNLPLTRKGLMEKKGVEIHTVDNWLRAGCPHRKNGYHVEFDLREVDKWLKNRR
jgi:excisionase family DNA binding protein